MCVRFLFDRSRPTAAQDVDIMTAGMIIDTPPLPKDLMLAVARAFHGYFFLN